MHIFLSKGWVKIVYLDATTKKCGQHCSFVQNFDPYTQVSQEYTQVEYKRIYKKMAPEVLIIQPDYPPSCPHYIPVYHLAGEIAL